MIISELGSKNQREINEKLTRRYFGRGKGGSYCWVVADDVRWHRVWEAGRNVKIYLQFVYIIIYLQSYGK